MLPLFLAACGHSYPAHVVVVHHAPPRHVIVHRVVVHHCRRGCP